MIFRTEGCTEFDHPEVTVMFDDEPVSDGMVTWFLGFLRTLVEGGQRLEPGAALQVGMRRLRVITRDDHTLGLEERVDGEEWGEHVDQALTDLYYQAEASAKLGLPEDLWSVTDDDGIGMQLCVLDAASLILHRRPSEDPQDVAWMLGCRDEHEHADWVLTEVFRAALLFPHLARFFALPTGIVVRVERDRVTPDGGVTADVDYEGSALTPDGGMYFGPDSAAVPVARCAVATTEGLEYRTSIGDRYGHPDVVVRLAEAAVRGLQDPLAQWLLDYLQDAIATGARFEVGQTIRVGWRLLRVVERADGLGLQERAAGGEWVEQVDATLRDLWHQREVVASVASAEQLSFPTEEQSALVAGCVADAPARLVLERSESADDSGSSGWAVSCGADHDHGGWASRPLPEVVASMPFVAQFLALPAPASVALDAPHTTRTGRLGARISVGGRLLEPLPGSYLAALAT